MSGRSMLKFMVVNRLPGLRRRAQNHVRADRKRNSPDGTPSSNFTSAIGQRWKLLGQVGRALPRIPTCRPVPSSRAPLALWSARLWFWNNHQEVIHLVALHKVILLQQLVARLRCLTKYHIAGHPMIFAISVAVNNSNFGPRTKRGAQLPTRLI